MPSAEQLLKLLQNEPEDIFLNFALAMELAKLDRQEEAVAYFDRVIELDRMYVAAYQNKAKILLALNRTDEAKMVLEAGIEVTREAGDHHAQEKIQDILDTFE